MNGIKVSISNLGPLRQVEFEPGRFTIVCGENNTGKTYATYVLFGFLHFWRNTFAIPILEGDIDTLIQEGSLTLELAPFLEQSESILANASEQFQQQLASLFAMEERALSQTKVQITVARDKIKPLSSFHQPLGFGGIHVLDVVLEPGEGKLLFTLLVEKKNLSHRTVLRHFMGTAVRHILFNAILPRPVIASVERTGAAIFRTELDIIRNRLLETMASKESKDLDPYELSGKVYSSYAWPVKENVNFARELDQISRITSFIDAKHPEIINLFHEIVGGKFTVRDGIPTFAPTAKTALRLGVNESSSSVRALLHIGYYLRHLARPGDLLMIDEPELNLHPKNQRRMARLLAMLCNAGVHVFITTHSDYIIRELNTLLLLHGETPRLGAIRDKYKYRREETIAADLFKIYAVADDLVLLSENKRRQTIKTLVPIPVDQKQGISISSFDDSIDEMNRIQDEIIFGGDEDEP